MTVNPPEQRTSAPELDSDRPAQVFPAALTTPTRPRQHGAALRGVDVLPSSVFIGGRFGRMFRNVPVFEHNEGPLRALASLMVAAPDPRDTAPVSDPAPADPKENPLIPSGFTYLGQFLDHDITFDPASSLQRQNDPDALHNFRTPRLDLDSLYGAGPADQPYLYEHGRVASPHPALGFDQRGVLLRLGQQVSNPDDPGERADSGPDLPRTVERQRAEHREARAVIGDPRNDENIIVSQLHSLFLRFHNRMAEMVFAETGLTEANLFKETQRRVRWHYQWIVVHDFLRRVVDGDPGDGSTAGEVIDDILPSETYRVGGTSSAEIRLTKPKLRFYCPRESAYMPIEFSVAAYRFGHSMIRPSYFINDFVKQAAGGRRIPTFSEGLGELDNLNGFRPLPARWGVDWRFFFDLDGGRPAQRSYKIDPELSNPLGLLPADAVDEDRSLAHRNLMRGLRLGLPSGQTVARAMGLEPIDPGLDTGAELRECSRHTPLWFYILKEAEVLGNSAHLGPVGGRIVAEVLIGLLAHDPLSYLNVEPNWQPDNRLTSGGRFGMKELIAFTAGDQFP